MVSIKKTPPPPPASVSVSVPHRRPPEHDDVCPHVLLFICCPGNQRKPVLPSLAQSFYELVHTSA